MNRKQDMHSMTATVITSKLQLLNDLIKIFKNCQLSNASNRKKALTQFNFILKCITRNDDRLTTQEIRDIQNEVTRLRRMMQLLKITESYTFTAVITKNDDISTLYEVGKKDIFGIKQFTDDIDKKVYIKWFCNQKY